MASPQGVYLQRSRTAARAAMIRSSLLQWRHLPLAMCWRAWRAAVEEARRERQQQVRAPSQLGATRADSTRRLHALVESTQRADSRVGGADLPTRSGSQRAESTVALSGGAELASRAPSQLLRKDSTRVGSQRAGSTALSGGADLAALTRHAGDLSSPLGPTELARLAMQASGGAEAHAPAAATPPGHHARGGLMPAHAPGLGRVLSPVPAMSGISQVSSTVTATRAETGVSQVSSTVSPCVSRVFSQPGVQSTAF